MIDVMTPATAVNGPGAWTIPWKGTDVAERTGTCEDCSTTFVAGSRGAVAKCCPECSQVRRREYEKTWSSTRPPREKTQIIVSCRDCSDEFLWTVRVGPLPDLCGRLT